MQLYGTIKLLDEKTFEIIEKAVAHDDIKPWRPTLVWIALDDLMLQINKIVNKPKRDSPPTLQ